MPRGAQNGTRHSIAMVVRAREHREAGWSYAEIGRLLEREFGRAPSRATVRLWTHPQAAARQRVAQRQRNAQRALDASGRLGGGFWACTPEFKLTRLRALEAQGLSVNSIAKVMAFDFGDALTEHKVRYALQHGRYPRLREAA